jgi:hypothetical protein
MIANRQAGSSAGLQRSTRAWMWIRGSVRGPGASGRIRLATRRLASAMVLLLPPKQVAMHETFMGQGAAA